MNFIIIICSFSLIFLIVESIPTLNHNYNNELILPEFLEICHRYDPNLNECILNNIENLKSRFGNGIPELLMPPLEPLNIPEIKIDQTTGPIFVHSIYKNIYIYGLSNFDVLDVQADIEENEFLLKLQFPFIQIEANYEIDGKLMMMPLKGDGNLQGNFTDVNVTGYLKIERYFNDDGIEHIRIQDITIHYTMDNLNINLDNLFNGEPTLGATMNKFLNDNWRVVGTEIKPVMQDSMSEMIKYTTNQFFHQFSFDQLFPI